MFLLESPVATGEHAVDPPIGTGVVKHVGPASCLPKLFGARGTRMEDNEWIIDPCYFQKLLRLFARRTRQLQVKCVGSFANPERLEQSQIIIEHVHFLEAKFRKLVVNSGPIA